MSEREKECTVFCPVCNVDKYDVYRVPTGKDGVFHHVTEPADAATKLCACGAVLERKS